MNQETIDFYDKESAIYSEKRYPNKTENFTQYLFKKRSAIFLSFIERILSDLPADSTMMEIGCADGILFRQVEEHFPGRFLKMVGMDISPKMIEVAEATNKNSRATFCLRDEMSEERYDVVVELGVHPYDLKQELAYASRHLKIGGYFFYSVVGSKSLYVRLKMKDESYISDYRDYDYYEDSFSVLFSVVLSRVYGLFLPKIWSVPMLARLIQPMADNLLRHVVPSLFHEKIYCLRSEAK